MDAIYPKIAECLEQKRKLDVLGESVVVSYTLHFPARANKPLSHFHCQAFTPRELL